MKRKIKSCLLHALDCDIPEEQNLLNNFFPGKSLKNRIRRFFLSKTIISDSNRISKFYFRSKASIEREKIRHLSGKLYRPVIHPCSEFRLAWATFIIGLTAFSIYELPMRISFNYILNGHIKYLIWMWIGFTIDVIYLVNVGLNFLTGYISASTNEIVMSPWRIARNYLFGFLVDTISSVPMDVMYYIFVDELNDSSKKITHLILNSFHLAKVFRLASIGHYMQDMGRIYGIDRYIPYRIFTIYVALMGLHWAACFQYLSGIVKLYTSPEMHSISWVTLYNLWNEPPAIAYIYALYRGTSLALGSSFGENKPITIGDTVLAVVTRTVGAVLFAMLIAHCVHIINCVYRSKEESADKMKRQLQSYLNDKQVPRELKKRVFDYFNYRYNESYYKQRNVEEALTRTLLEDILQHQAKKIEENVPLFRGLPMVLLTDIVSRMTNEHFLPNDIIIQANTIGNSMYFLSKGTVAVFTPTGKEICHLQDGAHFGEVALIKDSKRTASVMAIEPCETFQLHREDFNSVIHPDSQLWKNLAAEAQSRLERLERSEQQIWRTIFHGKPYKNVNNLK